MDTAGLKGKELFKFRRRVQPIFQDPYGSLDPMYNIFRTIEEPLRVHKIGNAASREKKVRELLDQVALPQSMMQRYPQRALRWPAAAHCHCTCPGLGSGSHHLR